MPQNSIRPLLNAIEKPIAIFLKEQGFRKKGRTFNRETKKGIIQVINFQSGTFPIGNYEIPGFRESLYGKFTVNLGVAIVEIWRVVGTSGGKLQMTTRLLPKRSRLGCLPEPYPGSSTLRAGKR